MTNALIRTQPQSLKGALTRSDKGRLALFAKTVGKGLLPSELNEAIDWCEVYRANPFTRDIYFFVFDAKDNDKRRLSPVLSIGLYRKIAARTGCYRPDETPPVFTYDAALVSPSNPKGIIDCTVCVFLYAHGAWHPIRERIRWEERAPIVAGGSGGFEWVETGEVYPDGHAKAGKKKYKKKHLGDSVEMLDPGKRNWHTMPETMLAKCAEAAAIRKGWPEDTAGSYVDGELDGVTIDLTAAEIIDRATHEERQAKLGGPSVIIDWCDGHALANEPADALHGKVRDFIRKNAEEPMTICAFADRNKASLRQFWTLKPDEALDLKKAFETYQAAAKAEAAE